MILQLYFAKRLFLQLHPGIDRINRAGDFVELEKAVIRACNAGAGQINDMRCDGFESGSEMVPRFYQQITLGSGFDAGMSEYAQIECLHAL